MIWQFISRRHFSRIGAISLSSEAQTKIAMPVFWHSRANRHAERISVRRRLIDMIDNHHLDRTLPRLQLEAKPMHSIENRGAFSRLAFVHVEIQIDVALKGGGQKLH